MEGMQQRKTALTPLPPPPPLRAVNYAYFLSNEDDFHEDIKTTTTTVSRKIIAISRVMRDRVYLFTNKRENNAI